MLFQLLLNFIIAMAWMLLHDSWDSFNFAIGFIAGFLIVFAMRRFFPDPFYGKKLWAIVKFFLLFLVEMYKSGLLVIKQVLQPKLSIQPGIFKAKTRLTGDWEITALSCFITLTPGSVVMEVDPKQGILFIHAMDIVEQEKAIREMMVVVEDAIMGVTR